MLFNKCLFSDIRIFFFKILVSILLHGLLKSLLFPVSVLSCSFGGKA